MDLLIDAYLDGELDQAGTARLREMLKNDPAKAAELAGLESAIGMLRRPVEAPDFAEAVASEVVFRSALADPLVFAPRRHSWLLGASIAAGLLLAVGAGVMVLGGSPRSTGPAQGPIAHRPPAEAPGTRTAANPAAPNSPRNAGDRSRGLEIGSTDKHDINGNWTTALKDGGDTLGSDSKVPGQADRALAQGSVEELPKGGRIVSLHVGPTWSLWWIPPDSGKKDSPSSEPWRLLTRLASPTNATVNKSADEIDKVK